MMKLQNSDQDFEGITPFAIAHGKTGVLCESDEQPPAARREHEDSRERTAAGITTQRTIAATLGTTQATVSRALRGDRSLTLTTRRRIVEAARRMGYQPSSHISVLIEHIREGKKIAQKGCIAILVESASESEWLENEACRSEYQGFVERANSRGYRTECFYLRGQNGLAKGIDRILDARGIVGLLFAAPSCREPKPVNLRWERYAMATFNRSETSPALNQVSPDRHFNVIHACGELRRRGCRRIGLSLPGTAMAGAAGKWLGGYLASQYEWPEEARLPLFVKSGPGSFSQFEQWYRQSRPDALLCLTGEEAQWIEQMGLSPFEDINVACLARPADSCFSGMSENSVRIGQIACDTIVNQLIDNKQGVPDEPRHILVEGTWKEGITWPLSSETTPPLLYANASAA